jgi:YHS domain-containing protein
MTSTSLDEDNQSANQNDLDADEPSVAIDPVCGMEVVDKDGALSLGYQGETVYFCSEVCRGKFLADPERYVVTDDDPEI